jgi:H+-transporting ATPase
MLMQIATVIAAKANWDFASVNGVGWDWAGVIWLYSLITYLPLDVIKFVVRYTLSGKAWDLVTEQRVCFFSWKSFQHFYWVSDFKGLMSCGCHVDINEAIK